MSPPGRTTGVQAWSSDFTPSVTFTASAAGGLRLAAAATGPWTASGPVVVTAGPDGRARAYARVVHTPLLPTAAVSANALNREGVPLRRPGGLHRGPALRRRP